jgi:hypothetical protein
MSSAVFEPLVGDIWEPKCLWLPFSCAGGQSSSSTGLASKNSVRIWSVANFRREAMDRRRRVLNPAEKSYVLTGAQRRQRSDLHLSAPSTGCLTRPPGMSACAVSSRCSKSRWSCSSSSGLYVDRGSSTAPTSDRSKLRSRRHAAERRPTRDRPAAARRGGVAAASAALIVATVPAAPEAGYFRREDVRSWLESATTQVIECWPSVQACGSG